MNRILGQVLTVAVVAALAPTLIPACAANDQTIYVRDVMAPPQNRVNGACLYLPDPTQPFLAEGTFDVGVRDSYTAFMLVGSQMQARGESARAVAESNRVHLNGAVVTVTETSGAVLGSFTAVGTGFVDPQANNASSYGLLGVTLIDAPTAVKIGGGLSGVQTKLVIANVKAFGKTLGGVDVESGEFQFPIRVCNGCLISFATGDDPAAPGRDCNLPLSATAGGGGNILPCNAGQDEVTPCQLCAQERASCRGG